MSHYTCSEFQEYDENEILSSTRSSDEWAPDEDDKGQLLQNSGSEESDADTVSQLNDVTNTRMETEIIISIKTAKSVETTEEKCTELKPRKRKRQPKLWKRNINKRKKIEGSFTLAAVVKM